ncbi:MAG TPA: PxKF domain-containing protein [Candidatus Angelobacter sp.]|nr:PxKF domain-containing protein [Candidatus Angelobacter sp.]
MLYVAGGGNGLSEIFSNLYIYDPVSDTWSAKASMPDIRNGESGAATNGAFYVVGGNNNATLATSTFAYDPISDTWSTQAPLSDPRNGLAAAVVGNIIYTMGGVDASGPVPVATVESYDPATNAWTTLPSMPTGLYAPAAAEVNGTVYVMGGLLSQSSGAISAANEAFTPVCNYQIVSTDNAGNFGFTAPLLNPGSGSLPNINSASVHQTIPLQVTVTDCRGNPATNLELAPQGTVGLTAANSNLCAVDNPDNSISTASAGNAGWQNLGGGVYQYNWKPLPSTGACLSFLLNLGDGLQHIAYFQFK